MNFHYCSILTFKESEFIFLNERYFGAGIKVILFDKNNINVEDKIPLLCINKEENSSLISKFSSEIKWTLSGPELSEKEISKFIEKSVWEFSPQKILTYDAFLEEEPIDSFIENIFNRNRPIFVFFKQKACYIHSDQTTLIINLESIQMIGINFKKILMNAFSDYSVIFLNYENCLKYLNTDNITQLITFENILWHQDQKHIVERNFISFFNDIMIYKHIPFMMEHISANYINFTVEEKSHYKNLYKKDIITHWLSQQKICFDKSAKIDGVEFEKNKGRNFLQLEYSNKRTITGRINCVDRKFNPQMLPKIDPIRNNIVSRYPGGKILTFDYVSFETKIALFLCDNKDFIDKYKNSDLHEESAKVIFQKENVIVSERDLGKQINHVILYGGGKQKISEKLSLFFKEEEIESVLSRLREFLKPILLESSRINKFYKNNGYVINPANTIVRPNKTWAAFNNYIQSTAADIVVDKLFKIKDFIVGKNISFMYQVYDSFVFDFSPECLPLINELSEVLSEYDNTKFLIEYTIGNNLTECGS